MNVGEIKAALDNYPDDAKIVVGIQIPDLYINTIANGSITGNHVDPGQSTKVQFLATVPPRMPSINFGEKQDASESEETTEELSKSEQG